ncbi:hypothetical protein WKH56_20600 [Priestia sp. SB1]|uniref:hypothetical protein n=1 Tax=Priestia sp. SB1 TaxID=3132359 RepID=UPI00316C1D02
MIKLSKRFMLTWVAVCIAGLTLCLYIPIKQAIEDKKANDYMQSQIDEMKHDTYLLNRIENMKETTK